MVVFDGNFLTDYLDVFQQVKMLVIDRLCVRIGRLRILKEKKTGFLIPSLRCSIVGIRGTLHCSVY